jgi:hypothetical protein
MLGLPRCLGFGGSRVDNAIATEILRVVEPMAIEAALEAEKMYREGEAERRRVAELDLQQAEYDASLAERRYATCDPDNRLIAAQLEKHWEAALRRVEECRAKLAALDAPHPATQMPNFDGLAADLAAAWVAPGVTTRARQQLIRALVPDIIADIDEATREVVLTIHWRGGQHSQAARAQAEGRQALSNPGARGDGLHGDALPGRRHCRHAEPHGRVHRTEQDMDGPPRWLHPESARHARLPLGR